MLGRLALDSAILPSPAKYELYTEASQKVTVDIARQVFLIWGELAILLALDDILPCILLLCYIQKLLPSSSWHSTSFLLWQTAVCYANCSGSKHTCKG